MPGYLGTDGGVLGIASLVSVAEVKQCLEDGEPHSESWDSPTSTAGGTPERKPPLG
jgi:hypothetical protein